MKEKAGRGEVVIPSSVERKVEKELEIVVESDEELVEGWQQSGDEEDTDMPDYHSDFY